MAKSPADLGAAIKKPSQIFCIKNNYQEGLVKLQKCVTCTLTDICGLCELLNVTKDILEQDNG